MSQGSFIEITIQGFARVFARSLLAEAAANQPGLLQQLDPRVRIIGIAALVVSVVLCRRMEVLGVLFLVAATLAVASGLHLGFLAKRVWLLILGFTGFIALPALFLTPGEPLFSLPGAHLTVTSQGMRTALLLVLRVETAATLTATLVLCTTWTSLLKALRMLHLPPEVVVMLAMTHRYVFLLVETANQMFESRKSRTVGVLTGAEKRNVAARTAGVLLSKSTELSHEVYLAMLSRGFRGDIHVWTDFRMRTRDYAGLAVFVFAGILAVWIGH